jgi:hypothetical protein
MIIKDSIYTNKASNAERVWGLAYQYFTQVVNKEKLTCGAEVGVAYGGHSEYILKHTKVEKLYAVDPYRHFPDYKDPMNLPQKDFDDLYSFTKNRLKIFGNRVKMVRKTSEDAAKHIKEPLDFVYLDANHSYDGVKEDLGLWFQKVRDFGVIGGHDYGHVNFPGVKKAIHEFFDRFGWEIHDEGEGVWWVQKNRYT